VMAEGTGGYPFLIQLVGHRTWRLHPNEEKISVEDADEGVRQARRRLGSLVYEPALADALGIDRTFLLAMAKDDGPSRMSEIQQRLGVYESYISQYRLRLIAAELIEPKRRGYVDFALPYMREYLRDEAAAEIQGRPRHTHAWRTLMQYRNLGRTGIKVSPYALGALMLATQVGNPDPEHSIRIIHKALDAGINLVDTADAYGDSEEVVGRVLKGRRDSVVLATKVGGPTGTDPNQQGSSRRWVVTAVENSLRRLQTDHIDIYQIHRPDPDTDIEETLSALTDLVRSARSVRSEPRQCRRRIW